jgi:hypothetical protein
METKFGNCQCGGNLLPVWFTEEETKTVNGSMFKTGRKRKACSHLECSRCFKRECVDDSFDSPFK